jgi:release factor glutamine methyltransferase
MVVRRGANLTVAGLLEEGAERLRASITGREPAGTPELDAQLLLAHVLAVPRTRLKSHPEELPPPSRIGEYRRLLARRAAGEPVAYLTGYRYFWSLRFAVTPAVLIPRPETELLVERALALLPAAEGRVADLGTGSGAVALALASERPGWRLIATDVSEQALAVARTNAESLGLPSVEFRQGDWYQSLAHQRFDLIVSNPPYVAADDPAMAAPGLSYEPRAALTPGADALASLREIVRGAPAHLARAGWLLLEHGATQGAEVREALVLAGFRHVRSHRDLAGHERATEGQTV